MNDWRDDDSAISTMPEYRSKAHKKYCHVQHCDKYQERVNKQNTKEESKT